MVLARGLASVVEIKRYCQATSKKRVDSKESPDYSLALSGGLSVDSLEEESEVTLAVPLAPLL
jgi:hypothetical protein